MIASPTDAGQMVMAGSPVRIVTWMPDVATGSVPIAFGNWPATYMVVNRRGLSFQRDDFSAGYCLLYKFESRIGGGMICPNAARLLRIG
jgi:HK97 family phage major capsid protein